MVETGKESLEEEYSWIHEMEDVKSKKYLGDILSCDGKNVKNITERKNRGIGIVTQIMTKLEDICLGKYYFKVAIILRNSLLISSMLTNAEAWYNLRKSDIEELESVDESFLRRILDTPISTPKDILYLEMGVVTIMYIIKIRRLNILQFILKEEEESLVHSFLKVRLQHPSAGDWGQSVKEDVDDLDI